MKRPTEDARRVAVWIAMADQFLDTETRQEIPLVAWSCVQAGLSTKQAADVWRYEVSPAVGFNLWSVAGEWGAWDREWLVERIERLRWRWDNRPGTGRWLRYRVRVHFAHRVWTSIARCMNALLMAPPGRREQMTADLAFLAAQFFDCALTESALPVWDRERACALYPRPFLDVLAPVIRPEDAAAGHQRVSDVCTQASRV